MVESFRDSLCAAIEPTDILCGGSKLYLAQGLQLEVAIPLVVVMAVLAVGGMSRPQADPLARRIQVVTVGVGSSWCPASVSDNRCRTDRSRGHRRCERDRQPGRFAELQRSGFLRAPQALLMLGTSW